MNPQPSDINRLVERSKSGDPEALGALYVRFAPGLMRLAHGILQSTSDAEDVLHDVFLGLPEALRQYSEQGSLESWLKRVTARVALTTLRSERRRGEVGLEPDVPLPATGQAPEALVERAIAQLPDQLRVVFVLKSVEGNSHAEIASLLDISVAASEVRLHRAIKLLRQRLATLRDNP